MENLGRLLIERCRTFAQMPALEGHGSTLTYRGLADRAGRIEEAARSAGLNPDEPVLVPVANETGDLAALIGVWLAGGVAVPVARQAPERAIATLRAATGARFSLTNAADAIIATTSDEGPPHRPLLAGAALVVFTSGSTGRPKGVVLSHRAFAGKLEAIDGVLGFTAHTRALLVLQITFVFGLWVSLLTLLRGGTLCMQPRFEALPILRALGEHRISDAAFVPSMLRKFLALDEALSQALIARACLERILTGGEPFGPELNARMRKLMPKAALVDIYGSTETCSSDFFLRADESERFAGTIGHPSTGVQIRIADEQGRELPVGSVGELQIRTPFGMNGYLDDPDLTRGAFAGEYFRSGDLASLRPDGRVELAGRIKDVIIRGGAKVSPLELDQVLLQHPAVAAALTAGIPDPVMGERIHALIVPRANASIEEKDLRAWMEARTERFKWPDAYHFGRELPTGRTGKIDRGALRDQVIGTRTINGGQ